MCVTWHIKAQSDTTSEVVLSFYYLWNLMWIFINCENDNVKQVIDLSTLESTELENLKKKGMKNDPQN